MNAQFTFVGRSYACPNCPAKLLVRGSLCKSANAQTSFSPSSEICLKRQTRHFLREDFLPARDRTRRGTRLALLSRIGHLTTCRISRTMRAWMSKRERPELL